MFFPSCCKFHCFYGLRGLFLPCGGRGTCSAPTARRCSPHPGLPTPSPLPVLLSTKKGGQAFFRTRARPAVFKFFFTPVWLGKGLAGRALVKIFVPRTPKKKNNNSRFLGATCILPNLAGHSNVELVNAHPMSGFRSISAPSLSYGHFANFANFAKFCKFFCNQKAFFRLEIEIFQKPLRGDFVLLSTKKGDNFFGGARSLPLFNFF